MASLACFRILDKVRGSLEVVDPTAPIVRCDFSDRLHSQSHCVCTRCVQSLCAYCCRLDKPGGSVKPVHLCVLMRTGATEGAVQDRNVWPGHHRAAVN